MFLESTRVVLEPDERPARPDGTCFYCRVSIGGEHEDGCVIRSRTVVVKATFNMLVEVPEDWDEHNIEFKYNESTYCMSNLVRDLGEQDERMGCVCSESEVEYLREADENDHDRFHYVHVRD